MDAIDHLKLLGFTSYESKAYLTLLKHSNLTGYEVAKYSGIPASKIYEVLNRLQEKEIIMALGTDPKRYVPFPPSEILNRLQAAYQHSFRFLQEKLEEMYEQDGEDQHYIWNISEHDPVFRKLRELLDQAEKEIFISIWAEELEELYPDLQRLEENGVQIYMVLFGESSHHFGKTYRHGREHEIRQERKARRLAIVMDDRITFLANFSDDGLTTAAYTRNKGMVLLAKDYIIHDIYTIRMQIKFGKDAMDIFRKVSS
jgi:sugar-specific transcriptional regulator TrmB